VGLLYPRRRKEEKLWQWHNCGGGLHEPWGVFLGHRESGKLGGVGVIKEKQGQYEGKGTGGMKESLGIVSTNPKLGEWTSYVKMKPDGNWG